MRVLLIHNYYRQPGGEDNVFADESSLLQERGHSVVEYTDVNERLESPIDLMTHVLWSTENYRKLKTILKDFKPDIVHIHNTFYAISPSVYYACSSAGIPVVQTLHNYRLVCPAATLYRNGSVCEECVGQFFPLASIQHACYRDSRLQTFGVASMLALHRVVGTWKNKVVAYIALTEFGKLKFIEGGLPQNKIFVKPNFLPADPGVGSHDEQFALFAGRISEEKGIRTLLDAWKITQNDVPLKVIGNGPLSVFVKKNISNLHGVEYFEKLPRLELLKLMQKAFILVVPSELYEGFGLVVIEAFACGLPVIASNHGALSELIIDGVNGMLFSPSDSESLAEKVKWAKNHPDEIAQMGSNARKTYEEKYTAQKNYDQLLQIYKHVIFDYSRRKI